jgi:hypothetical protein
MTISPTPPTAYGDRLAADPVLQRLFWAMPAHVRATFSREQIEALADATRPARPYHILAIRRTVRLPGRRYYLAVLVGRDRRRKLSRLELYIQRGMKESWFRRVVVGLGLLLLAACVALGVICIAYLAKSALNIDLLDGHSLLHDLLYWR